MYFKKLQKNKNVGFASSLKEKTQETRENIGIMYARWKHVFFMILLKTKRPKKHMFTEIKKKTCGGFWDPHVQGRRITYIYIYIYLFVSINLAC